MSSYSFVTKQVQYITVEGYVTGDGRRMLPNDQKRTPHPTIPDAEQYLKDEGWETPFGPNDWRHPKRSYSTAKIEIHEEANRNKWQ